MVNGNDIYSHFNDVLNVNEAKLCFPRGGRRRRRQHYTLLGLRFYPRLAMFAHRELFSQLSVALALVTEGFHTEGDANLGTNLDGLKSFISLLLRVFSVSAS